MGISKNPSNHDRVEQGSVFFDPRNRINPRLAQSVIPEEPNTPDSSSTSRNYTEPSKVHQSQISLAQKKPKKLKSEISVLPCGKISVNFDHRKVAGKMMENRDNPDEPPSPTAAHKILIESQGDKMLGKHLVEV